jgi:molybdate transport system substrate-binding protein
MASWLCASSVGIAHLLAALVGCEAKKETSRPPSASVTVFVAASTKDVVEELASIFRKETWIEVKVSPGPSNTLAAQIAEGAPADLFLSASEEWADSLQAKGRVLEARKLLGNSLVIVVPRENPATVKNAEDLRGSPVKKVALAGEKVPAGKYAEQALKALNLYQALLDERKIVRGQDVRGTLAYVERAEVEAGIVYATDARVAKDVEIACRFDPKAHEPIVYPLVLLKAAEKNEGARKLYTFLCSPEARAVFGRHGFTVSSEAP